MYPYDNAPYNQDLMKTLLSNTQPQAQPRHVTKVNGRAGADAFSMPPNSDDLLLDMNDPIIWFVQTDGAGYKTVTPYDISLHKEVNKEDRMNALEERISKLEEAITNVKSNFRENNSRPKSGNGNNDASSRSNA